MYVCIYIYIVIYREIRKPQEYQQPTRPGGNLIISWILLPSQIESRRSFRKKSTRKSHGRFFFLFHHCPFVFPTILISSGSIDQSSIRQSHARSNPRFVELRQVCWLPLATRWCLARLANFRFSIEPGFCCVMEKKVYNVCISMCIYIYMYLYTHTVAVETMWGCLKTPISIKWCFHALSFFSSYRFSKCWLHTLIKQFILCLLCGI